MQLLLTVFCIIALVLVIVSSSSNISIKPGSNINTGINTTVGLVINNILSLSIEDKTIIFSSLLQTISAQEQEETEPVGEEDGKDTDVIIKGDEEEQQNKREGNETKSSLGQQEDDTEKEQQQKQDYRDEPGGKEELPQENEKGASLDNKDDDNSSGAAAAPVTMEEQSNDTSSNNDTSSDVSEDRTENSSQNSTDSHSIERRTKPTANNSSTSTNESQRVNASKAQDDSFTLGCNPAETKMLPGEDGSITCTIENETPKPIELVLACSGLQGTGIDCYINGGSHVERTLKERSLANFTVLLISRSSPPTLAGSYPFTISAEECINSDLC